MANYTLKVPLSSEQKEFAEMVIKELEDRTLFTMVQKAMQNDELQAVEIMLNGLWVSGDPVKKITDSLYALRSATKTLLPLLSVADGELKKKLTKWKVSELDTEDELRKRNALLRYHFHLNPDLLSDDEWAQRWGELEWVLKQEANKITG